MTDLRVAIDFGISNTDAVASVNGSRHYWTRPSSGVPDHDFVRSVLAAGGIALDSLASVAVTGGQHKSLPALLGNCAVLSVNEMTAVGRGGQALSLADPDDPATPVLVVSAGSGTAVVSARGAAVTHVTGTGVGGGTLLGLGRLLLHTTDVREIDALAMSGNANGADLALRDVVSGPIGSLPPDATAVNFGRLARAETTASREDLAAALVTLVGQVIAITAINAARAERIERIVVIGHMADLPSFRRALEQVGIYYGTRLTLPAHAGFGTAIGALMHEHAAG
jgi:type II pantothenate kinase